MAGFGKSGTSQPPRLGSALLQVKLLVLDQFAECWEMHAWDRAQTVFGWLDCSTRRRSCPMEREYGHDSSSIAILCHGVLDLRRKHVVSAAVLP